jgi:hypothetical protein
MLINAQPRLELDAEKDAPQLSRTLRDIRPVMFPLPPGVGLLIE